MRIFVVLFTTVCLSIAQARGHSVWNGVNIIPVPSQISESPGEFTLTRRTALVASDAESQKIAFILNRQLLHLYGFELPLVNNRSERPSIIFDKQNIASGTEGYRVSVGSAAVRLEGSGAGLFYAAQTFLQLLPADIKSGIRIPAVNISDAPRFQYRGMMLDVARHFYSVEFVKRFIDLMARYKLNRFHWHLTDDQGWRIEIKKHPRLTQVGAFRPETQLGKNSSPYIGDGMPHGGYYTQEQIREIVAYAKARYVTVIPEIEMPGHSSAALAAYPEIGCKENSPYKVPTHWGHSDKDVLCPNEAAFKLLEDVLAETIGLFPDAPYIHIGGDEVSKRNWIESSFVQDLKLKENLKNEEEVQSYFIRRIERFVNSKGRRIIGWDEILEGGLAPKAVVMSWRGEAGGIEAAKSGHDVVMATSDYLYHNYGQGDPLYEPINHRYHLPLEKVYGYDPVPKQLTPNEAKHVLGVQGSVWTEYFKTAEQIEYQILPRMLALSEVAWSRTENKNYADFQERLQDHYRWFDTQKLNYRIPEPTGLKNQIVGNGGSARFDLRSQIRGAKIYYTTDGSNPTEHSKIYSTPFEVSPQSGHPIEVKTIVVNAVGRKSSIYAATVMPGPASPAVDLNRAAKPGLTASFFEGSFQVLADIDRAEPGEKRESRSIWLSQFSSKTNGLKKPFGAKLQGYIYVPRDEVYKFQLETDDDASLVIDDQKVVRLEGMPSKNTRPGRQVSFGVIALANGYHKFTLNYVQVGGDSALDLFWGVKGEGLTWIRGPELFH